MAITGILKNVLVEGKTGSDVRGGRHNCGCQRGGHVSPWQEVPAVNMCN